MFKMTCCHHVTQGGSPFQKRGPVEVVSPRDLYHSGGPNVLYQPNWTRHHGAKAPAVYLPLTGPC